MQKNELYSDAFLTENKLICFIVFKIHSKNANFLLNGQYNFTHFDKSC